LVGLTERDLMMADVDYQGVPHTLDPWRASPDRYAHMVFRRVGKSGLMLPAISLGLWYNFGDNRPFDVQREVLHHAFDKGITHFDLANNYGPPYGAAEENVGRMMRTDFRPYRHELISLSLLSPRGDRSTERVRQTPRRILGRQLPGASHQANGHAEVALHFSFGVTEILNHRPCRGTPADRTVSGISLHSCGHK